ncbi:flavodoxin family protein [Candidatus Gracilibacteria bacterium]|nr:flavodoxin family protein [Candidatus Gracilibacteria bacterium]
MSKVHIVYGSCSGNTQMVCEKIAETLAAKHEVKLFKAMATEPEDLKGFDVLIMAAPTYGHGEMEMYMERLMIKMKDFDLKGAKCAIIALGDPKYEEDYHLETAKMLKDWLKAKGAEILGMPLRVSKSPVPHLDGYIKMWGEN